MIHFYRWGELESLENQSVEQVCWLDIIGLRFRVKKNVKGTVGILSSVCYPDVESFQRVTPQCVMEKCIEASENLFSEFVQEELEELA